MQITDEMIEATARDLATQDLACGDAAGVVKTAVDVRWKEYIPAARAAIAAALPMMREAALLDARRKGEVFTLGKLHDLVKSAREKAIEDCARWHDAEAKRWEAELRERRSWGGPTIGAGECLEQIKAHEHSARAIRAIAGSPPRGSLQERVAPWMQACFGPEIAADAIERRHRFTEEALELLQAMGGTKHEATQLVDYVFGREKGEPHQEVGGVMITLAALCLATGLDMHRAGEDELARIWTKVDVIRAKQAAKPKHSVLPIPSSTEGPRE